MTEAADAHDRQAEGLNTTSTDIPLRQAVSPYSTGGGGVTLERRVAASYLALLLTGESAPELGDGRRIVSIAFQQAPRVPVDDLVILAQRPDESEPSLELALGIRRAPNIVPSDDDTQKLIVEYVRALLTMPADGREHRLALVVAGPQSHAEQLDRLAGLATDQMDAASFFTLVQMPRRFDQALRERLDYLVKMVAHALAKLGVKDADDTVAQLRTWEFLTRLSVLMLKVEDPDVTDWVGTLNRLVAVARGNDLVGAGHLRDRLETLAARFAPNAATVDLPLLRQEVHSLLELGKWRHQQGWMALEHLQAQAQDAVRHHIGLGDPAREFHLDRTADGAALIAAAKDCTAMVVHGESGVGKSALALGASTNAAAADPDGVQAVCLNLRQLPVTSLELVTSLGCSLEELLGELSAPHRFLIIDGADAATETRRDMFVYLVNAAHVSGVVVVAVAATESRQVVHDLLVEHLGAVTEYPVAGLSDADLSEIATRFPELRQLVANGRSRELLRRLVVIDLLVRSKVTGLPLSEVDAMRQIWAGLVRRPERRDRGLPDARERVLVLLARRELFASSALDLSLDAQALDGLRQDGLLRASSSNPWQLVPEFAHDELRRYAVARLLLANGDPAGELRAAGAPRWALSAGRLACQALLVAPDNATSPLHGRLGRVQASFDSLIAAGHGDRWGDLPGEALLALGDPEPLLADAWPDLRAGDAAGLHRVLRLMGQRHRHSDGFIDLVVAEPIVALLLNDPTPWQAERVVAKTLREWLLALVVQDSPVDHPLRIRLRERLVDACAAGDARLVEEEAAAAEARAALTPEEIEEEEQWVARRPVPLGRERRPRPPVPREMTDKTVLELLALLGPDLGEQGEQILRRVGRDAPGHLAPAVEELGTGRALASYGRGLLADLTEAYYLDDEEDGSRYHEDGIRDHSSPGPGGPRPAWNRGSFWALFQSDFRRGVALLNRMLNHAARVRARILADLNSPSGPVSDDIDDHYTTELQVTGSPVTYVGDDHVWLWYRGTSVGPYPCMSALQALERVCDQILAAGVPLERLVHLLLDGCENLAMVGLIVGLLVRHLERAGTLLDPFLAEPAIWRLEFSRLVGETRGLGASSDGLVEPERRRWSFYNVAAWLVFHADPDRADQLRSIGAQMVAAAELGDASVVGDEIGEDAAADGERRVSSTTTVRKWASALDRNRYHTYIENGVMYFQCIPPDDVEAALQPGNDDLQRDQEAMRLVVRYLVGHHVRRERRAASTEAELAADLVTAQELLDNPPTASPMGIWSAPVAVAAAALEAHMLGGMNLPSDSLEFAVKTVLAIAEGAEPPREFESAESYFEQGADRIAAGALPLLLLPMAAPLRDACGEADGTSGADRILSAGRRLAQSIPNETRLHLARGLDAVWNMPCQEGVCHHELALDLAVESMRDCVLGSWDPDAQRRRIELVEEPVTESLAVVAAKDIIVLRLDAAIRALGAAVRGTCVATRARDLLTALLDTQRRALLTTEHADWHGTPALVAARALLGLAAAGDDEPLHRHIETYATNSALLGSTLRALAAAAEESPSAAEAARRVWPDIIAQVVGFAGRENSPFTDAYFGQEALAVLMPNATSETSFLYWEVERAPIAWTDTLAWRSAIEAWLPLAAGRPQCVDSLIGLVTNLPTAEQVEVGLPWIEKVVLANVQAIARRTYRLPSWLIDIRAAAVDANALSIWQRIVDALVVAGDTTLAPYSE